MIQEKEQNKNIPEESDTTEDQAPIAPEVGSLSKFSSPSFLAEAMIMLPIALLIDLAGFILFLIELFIVTIPFCIAISFIVDGFGIVLIGGWMLFRSGRADIPEGVKKRIKKRAKKQMGGASKKAMKSGKKIGKRLGLSVLGELFPIVGDALPLWTIAVFFELKNN